MRYLSYALIFIPALLFSYDIAIIGDSISAGYGLAPQDRYSEMLKKTIPGITVNNTAVNFGSTIQTDEFIFKAFGNDSPKVLILALGTADAGYYHLPPDFIYENLEKIIKTAEGRETIVLLGRVELGKRFDNLTMEYITEFHDIYLKMFEQNPNVIQFDFMNDILFLDPYYTLDKTHPNVHGNRVIAEVLAPIIIRILN